jgi:hypothetical protein
VGRIEKEARKRGLKDLDVGSSITAEPFYAALGYSDCGHAVHRLASGKKMACVKCARHCERR